MPVASVSCAESVLMNSAATCAHGLRNPVLRPGLDADHNATGCERANFRANVAEPGHGARAGDIRY
jgi:hypothetical protein